MIQTGNNNRSPSAAIKLDDRPLQFTLVRRLTSGYINSFVLLYRFLYLANKLSVSLNMYRLYSYRLAAMLLSTENGASLNKMYIFYDV